MHNSTPAKSKLGYFSGQSKSKSKDLTADNSLQKNKGIFADDNDLFSGMDKGNLSYLESQILTKEKEKRKIQKRIQSEEKQKLIEAEALQKHNLTIHNTIVQIDASQQETQRSQEKKELIIKPKVEQVNNIKQFPIDKTSHSKINQEEQQQSEPCFQYIDEYIKSLQKLPLPKHQSFKPSKFRNETSTMQRNKYSKQSLKQSIRLPQSYFVNIQQRQLQKQFKNLESKYKKQNRDSIILNCDLEDCRKQQQQQIAMIRKLQQNIEFSCRSIEKIKKQRQKIIKKNNQLYQAISVNRHYVSLSTNNNKSNDVQTYYQSFKRYQYDFDKRKNKKEKR